MEKEFGGNLTTLTLTYMKGNLWTKKSRAMEHLLGQTEAST